MTRDVATGVIKAHGGDVVGAMSGRVTHLLTGTKLEDGRPVQAGQKWQAAQASKDQGKPVDILSEDELYELMENTLPDDARDRARAARIAASSALPSTLAQIPPPPAAAAASSSAAMDDEKEEGGAACAGAVAAATDALVPSSRRQSSASSAAAPAFQAEQLWVDKYAPRDFGDLVGNRKEVDAIDAWLRRWEAIHIRGEKVAGSKENPGARAVLISG